MKDTCMNKKKPKKNNLIKEDCSPEEKEQFLTNFIKCNLDFIQSYLGCLINDLSLNREDNVRLEMNIAMSLLANCIMKLEKTNARLTAKTLFIELIKHIEGV